MRILFHSNQLSLRGAEVALYDYAKYNEEILGNESIIITNVQGRLDALEKFRKRFNVILYDHGEEINEICLKNKIDIFYALKYGIADGIISDVCKTVVHAVFPVCEPHGDVYAYISKWLSEAASKGKFPYVPHIVSLPSCNYSLRKSLNIPEDAIVFGYHGGSDSFDISFAQKAVYDIALRRRDIYFIFMNIDRFCEGLPNIIHLEGTYDMEKKAAFINTCDAMIHARMRGETFGLSVGEFSIMNKPVVTWYDSPERNHIEILGDKGIYYHTYEDLVEIIENFKPDPSICWDRYSHLFSPDNVMKRFKEIFIESVDIISKDEMFVDKEQPGVTTVRDTDILQKNMESLKKVNPSLTELLKSVRYRNDIKIMKTKDGLPSIKVQGTAIHSLYNPVKEAREWVNFKIIDTDDVETFIVLGFGLAYHISELCRSTDKEIVVFEPRLDLIKMAFEHLDLTDIIPRVKIITNRKVPFIEERFQVLEHTPSINLNQAYYEHISSRIQILSKIKKGLKIMVVAPIYGGSYPVAKYCCDALKSLGHDVDFVDNGIYEKVFFAIDSITSDEAHREQLRDMLVNYISETVVARVVEFKPDLVFSLAQAPLNISSLIKLKDNKIPTAFWFVEDYKLLKYWKEIAPLYDYFFAIQKGEFFEELKEIGVQHYSYLPLAASPEVHRELSLTEKEYTIYGSDISFVGAGYKNRRKFFEGLIDLDFKIWGNEWDLNTILGRFIQRNGERIDTDEIVKIFNATKININLHSSPYLEGINPYGDFVNPRTFEIAACGGFQLVDYRSELPELFEPGKEVVCISNIYDLRQKIKYYLNNPVEREKIALAGKERVLREHTYEHRMKSMLRFIFERGFTPPVWQGKCKDIDILIKEAEEYEDLREYLGRFKEKDSISLNDIMEDIYAGAGGLTEVEKIFVLMNSLEKDYSR